MGSPDRHLRSLEEQRRTVVPQPSHGTAAGTTHCNKNWDPTKCHPINKLPVEILSRILFFSFSFKDLAQIPTAHPTAHVCQLWQAIVTETPDFWTMVTNRSTENEVELKLRKSAKASIEIVYCDCMGQRLATHSFLKLIAPHIERWGSICTEGPAPTFFEAFRNFPDVQLPRLPLWTLKRKAPSSAETAFLNNLPSNIVDIRIEGLIPSWGSNINYWLTSLELCGSLAPAAYMMLFTALAMTLETCPNLKILRLGPLSPRQSGGMLNPITALRDSGSVIPAPSLEHLKLRGAHSIIFSRLLKKLAMPKLSKIFLRSNNWVAAPLDRDAGGRSLLQTALDNAGCSSLTVSVGRATTLEWIKIHGETGGSRKVEIELLKKAGGVSRNVYGLNLVTIPVQLRVIGSPSGFLLPLLQRTPTASHLWYRPHLDSGWKSVALIPEDLANLPSQWEHTLGPAPSPVLAFIRDCYAWYSVEMRYGDPLRKRRLMDIEYDFDTTKPVH